MDRAVEGYTQAISDAGRLRLRDGNFEDADRLLRFAVELGETRVEVVLSWALCLSQLGKINDAKRILADVRQSIEALGCVATQRSVEAACQDVDRLIPGEARAHFDELREDAMRWMPRT